MWGCLLLFCIQFAVGITSDTFQCPTKCYCSQHVYDATRLTVDCLARTDINPEQLTKQLDSLLSSILTYGRMTHLAITDTPLTRVPSSVCRLKTLTELDLKSNLLLTRLPDNCLTNLTNLERFDAQYNAIEALQDAVFDGLTNLTHLYFSFNNISSIGSSVCQLTALTHLFLDHNRLTRMPDCFTNLTNLMILQASNNIIMTLPAGAFDEPTKLHTLDLRWNNISSIGLSVCSLKSLEYLYFDHNQITRLPDNCFNNLTNLVKFSACDNAIETLQDGVFNGLRKLQHLDLSSNKISYIGLSVFAFSSELDDLSNIDLSSNNLTYLEPWIFHRNFKPKPLYGWEKDKINLTNNRISKFTNKMGRYSLVCGNADLYVYLENNSMRHFMDIWNGWQIYSRPTFLYQCYGKKLLLSTDGNNIPCDCIDYHFYKEAALKNIQTMWGKATCNLTDPLTKKSSIVKGFELDESLFVCELTEHCPARCICVHRPATFTLEVYCNKTNLRKLPLVLPDLPDSRTKYKLDFSRNRLLHRLEHRDYFVNTSIFDVSNSGVDNISDWEKIVKIPYINLSGNKITSLPQSLTLANISGKLNLTNNPWNCSCNKKWMSKWFNYTAGRLTEQVRCYFPYRLRGKFIIHVSDEEFCVDPTTVADRRTLIISLSSVVSLLGVLVVLVSVGVIVYRLRDKLYTRWKFHPFDRDECLGEDMDYDVFLCYSSLDDDPHGQSILKLIESKGYRVCYHERDFLPGTIAGNISRAVERSKRTV